MPRVFPGKTTVALSEGMQPVRHDAPRMVRSTVVDFTSLHLRGEVRLALAEAFWAHFGIQSERNIHTHWFHIKTFDRFARESGMRGVSVLSSSTIKHMLKPFCERHGLPRFSLASIRPGVLSAFYRASGDLRRTGTVANHAHLATTVRYVETPEVQAQHRARIAVLQSAFIKHIEQRQFALRSEPVVLAEPSAAPPPGELVSMFGFGCTDPLAGTAPGTHRGELCTNFMGCFTCPNAIITPDPPTVARLLQARDHLRAAATTLHPARWQAFYAPQLRILEEDILPRFAARELAAAHPLLAQLSPLPALR